MLLLALFVTEFVGCDKKGEEQVTNQENDFDKIVSDRITAEEWLRSRKNLQTRSIISECICTNISITALFPIRVTIPELWKVKA